MNGDVPGDRQTDVRVSSTMRRLFTSKKMRFYMYIVRTDTVQTIWYNLHKRRQPTPQKKLKEGGR